MSKVITLDDGTEETVFTQAELDAQLAEKDAHVAEKLKEFQTGKTAQELKDIETQKKIEETNAKAEEAITTAKGIVESTHKKVINFVATQFVGEDKELRTKLDDAYGIIEAGRIAKGLDVNEEASITEMMRSAASMSGINNVADPKFPMTGGMAPSFIKTPGELSDAEHEAFLKATGQEVPKKAA